MPTDNEVRQLFRDAFDDVVADDRLHARVRRAQRRRRTRRASLAGAAAVVAAGVLAVAVTAVTATNTDDEVRVAGQPRAREATTLPYRDGGQAIAGRDAWLGVSSDTPARVVHLDAISHEVAATVEVPIEGVTTIALTPDKAWVASAAFGEDLQSGAVIWIDTRTNEVGGAVDASALGRWSPDDMVAVGETIWVADSLGGRVVRIDATTGRIVDTVAVAGATRLTSDASGGVWCNAGGDLARINETAEVVVEGVPTISLSGAADGSVWVARTDDRLEHYGADGTLLLSVPTGHLARVAAVADGAWIADTRGIRKVDLAGDVVGGTELVDQPSGSWELDVADDGAVWRKDSSLTTIWSK